MNAEKKELSGLEGRDCVPFFRSDKNQIIFEFFYLIIILVLACSLVLFLQLCSTNLGISHTDKQSLFSILGGFLGGWVYDAKWFYRVTARGKSDQYGFPWQPHKFYWRILTPFLSALVAFSVYLLAATEIIPFTVKDNNSAKIAFSVSFITGYFSDLVLNRLAATAEKIAPKASQNDQ